MTKLQEQKKNKYDKSGEIDEIRGVVKEIIFVLQYPDWDIKVAHLDPSDLHSIVLDHESIKAEVKNEEWNTGEWKNNPTMLLMKKRSLPGSEGLVRVLYCQKTGHWDRYPPTQPI